MLGGQNEPEIAKAYRIVWLQVAVSLVIALPLGVFFDALAGVSSFMGGAIGFITSWAYIKKMTAPAGGGPDPGPNPGAASKRGSDPRVVLRNHVMAEVLKLGLTVILFAAVFIFFKGVAVLPLLLTFMVTLAVYWVALLIVF